MKFLITVIAFCSLSFSFAQKKTKRNSDSFQSQMHQHHESLFHQMKKIGDLPRAITSLNNMLTLKPNSKKSDTLALMYLKNNQSVQAIAVLDNTQSKSELALKTKALAYKNLNNPKKAIENYEQLVTITRSVLDAYELAQLQYSLQRLTEAKATISFGLQNATNEKVRLFIQGKNYIETPVKAAFLNMLGLIEYNSNKNKIDHAIAIFDQALKIDPNFALAIENKKGLIEKKNNSN